MTKSEDLKNLYIEREYKRRLKAYPAFGSLKLSAWVSFSIFLLLALGAVGSGENGTDFNLPMLAVSLAFLAPALLSFYLTKRVQKDILVLGDVREGTMRAGGLLLPFMLLFNVFAAIAGFTLIKKGRHPEYLLGAWSILTSVCVIVISMFNVFKPAVVPTFFLGIGLLSLLTVLYTVATFLAARWIKDKQVDKRMLPVGVLLILSSFSGNLFALLMGIMILSKLKSKDKSIEWIEVVKRLFRNNMALVGMFVVTFLFSVSICSALTFDERIALNSNFQVLLHAPSLQFPFGTDDFGRCVFTRIIFGARISLIIGFVSTIIPIIIGGALGAIAGHYGNLADNVVMRFMDVLFSVPGILLAIAIISAFGASTTNLIIALSVWGVPVYARTMRAQVLSVSNSEFVEAAKSIGQRRYQIVLKHIVPNSMAPMIVRATMGIGTAVLSTSALSFLGLGVEPHVPEWGNILRVGSRFLELHPHLAIYPGLAIVIIVLAFNYFGDGLLDGLNPKTK